VDYQTKAAIWMNVIQGRLTGWWADLRGDNGGSGSIAAVGYAVLYIGGGIMALFVFVWSCRKIVKLKVWARLWDRYRGGRRRSQVEFYERLLRILSRRGHVRHQDQTPLEFAYSVGDAGVVKLTEKYNLVRFGDRPISKDESSEIENLLRSIENDKGPH
ncbi:MAG: DUF4129 domain-containing protein, partial [Acidobacteriota bacterium]